MVIQPEAEKRRARIVAERGLLELRAEGGKTLRTLIYERASPDGESRARAVLIKAGAHQSELSRPALSRAAPLQS
jgi:hypothetical protein